MVCNRQHRPDGWTEGRRGRMTGRAGSGAASFVIPMSFNIYNYNIGGAQDKHLMGSSF